MSAKVERCERCGKRFYGQQGWSEDYVAGLVVGHLCPDCQSPHEDREAELDLIAHVPANWPEPRMEGTDDLLLLEQALVKTYPTPEIMRHKANLLASARKDRQALYMARLMLKLADDLESWRTPGRNGS